MDRASPFNFLLKEKKIGRREKRRTGGRGGEGGNASVAAILLLNPRIAARSSRYATTNNADPERSRYVRARDYERMEFLIKFPFSFFFLFPLSSSSSFFFFFSPLLRLRRALGRSPHRAAAAPLFLASPLPHHAPLRTFFLFFRPQSRQNPESRSCRK